MRVFAILLILLWTWGCSGPKPRGPLPSEAPSAPERGTQPGLARPPQTAPHPESPVVLPKRLFEPLLLPKVRPRYHLPSVMNPRDGSIMVRIPEGTYALTHQEVQGGPIRLENRHLPEFFIDVNEITVAQYRSFDPAYDETPYTGGPACPDCPAMAIDWSSAFKYCRWAGKELPSEWEWEAAARGATSNTLPWGERRASNLANLWGEADGFRDVAPVRSLPQGASPLGVLDMIGNVWEWVRTPAPAEFPGGKPPDNTYLLKGGGWRSPVHIATIPYRLAADAAMKNPTFGFRCARPGHLPR